MSEPQQVKQVRLRPMVFNDIKAARQYLGISQRKLSELSGISSAHIARMELYDINSTMDTLKQLANGLNLTMRVSWVDRATNKRYYDFAELLRSKGLTMKDARERYSQVMGVYYSPEGIARSFEAKHINFYKRFSDVINAEFSIKYILM